MTDWGLIMIRYIQDTEHYTEVLSRMMKARRLLWIATADLKDLYVKHHGEAVPFLKVLSDLVKRGVEVRLLHAKEPGQPFREDFDKYPALWTKMERRLCPRVHCKLIAIDSETVYIGSANMTGAGMGMKSENRRNFEAGIMTDEPGFVDSVMSHFDSIWEGTRCTKCGRKDFCGDRIK
jgi:phosphatidylserine/phosphatidylglycerophosphate/cardiolipin synthase-like enzyme